MLLLGENNLPAFGVTKAGEGKKAGVVRAGLPTRDGSPTSDSRSQETAWFCFARHGPGAGSSCPPTPRPVPSIPRVCRAGPFLRLGASRDATARGPGSAPQGFGDPNRLQPLPKGVTATQEPTAFLFHHHNLPGVTTDSLAPLFPPPNRSFRLSTLPRNAARCLFAEPIPTAAPWKALRNSGQPCQQHPSG